MKRNGSYIKSPKWLKNKKATINPQNYDDDNCFKYAVTAALNYQIIESHPERISNIMAFINPNDWKGIEFSITLKGLENI